MKLHEIVKLIKTCREYGVLELKVSEVEFKLSPIHSNSHNAQVSERPVIFSDVAKLAEPIRAATNELTPNNVELADEDLLFWSSGSESDKKSA